MSVTSGGVGGRWGCQTSMARWVCLPESRDTAAAALKRLLAVSPGNSKYKQGRNAETGAWTNDVCFKINCVIIGVFYGFLRVWLCSG